MGAGGGFGYVTDQAHFQRAIRADGFKFFQSRGIVVDVVLQLFACVAQICGIQENGWNTGIDKRGFQTAYIRHINFIDQIAGWEHTAFAVGRIKKFDLYFGCRKSYAVKLKIARFQYFAVLHRYMGDDGFADVFLPDFDGTQAV